jgi:hypothetical protein
VHDGIKEHKRMKIISIFLLSLFAFSAYTTEAWSACKTILFYVAKSTNQYAVYYEAKMNGDKLSTDAPIDMFWRQIGGSGRRELGFLETKLAFGIKYRDKTADKASFTVAALPSKLITVVLENGCPVAYTRISGKSAVLTKAFAQMDGATDVEYIDLTGRAGGSSVTERLVNE